MMVYGLVSPKALLTRDYKCDTILTVVISVCQNVEKKAVCSVRRGENHPI